MPKIKKIVFILSAFLSLGYFGSIPALADPGGCSPGYTYQNGQCVKDAGSGSGGNVSSACKGVTNDPKVSCADCQPGQGSTPSLCTCHPEYYYGAPLTTDQLASCEKCNQAGLKYAIDAKATSAQKQTANLELQDCLQKNPITNDINIFVNILSALATLAIIGTLIAGGIQYAMAGNPQAAANARKRVTNGLVALVGLFFIWAFLQWLIPGGI